ncbi:MAG TPA: KH domain-containing protein [Myxococcaceae bacterium]
MEELLMSLARGLVDRPDQVELRSQPADGGTLFELKVAPEDVGKVIGRDGRTVNAIRTLLAVAAQRRGVKARLEVLDDRRNAAAPTPPSEPPPAG